MNNVLNTSRLPFVDQLKGLAIFLVIMGHIYNFSLRPSVSYVSAFIGMIHMPVFMFVAGCMFKRKENAFTIKGYGGVIAHKLSRVLIPFLSITMIACIVRGWNYFDLLNNGMKYGYWFLLTLFMYYVVYYPFLYLFRRFPKYVELVILAFFSMSLISGCKYISLLGGVKMFFSLEQFAQYSFPFLAGMWLREHTDILEMMERKNSVNTVLIVLFLTAFFLFVRIEYGSFFATLQSFGLRFLMIGISGEICWILFKRMNLNNKWGNSLAWLGKNSLPVYVLHYFFLPNVVMVKEKVDSLDGVLLVAISIPLALFTLFLTLASYKVLSHSFFCQKYLFGNVN